MKAANAGTRDSGAQRTVPGGLTNERPSMTDKSIRTLANTVFATGVALAFVSAVVPFYTAGHVLLIGVLVAGVMPYLAFGLAAALHPSHSTNAAGAIVLLLHAVLVINERFVGGADYSDGMIYLVPLALTALLGPLVVSAVRQPWRRSQAGRKTP